MDTEVLSPDLALDQDLKRTRKRLSFLPGKVIFQPEKPLDGLLTTCSPRSTYKMFLPDSSTNENCVTRWVGDHYLILLTTKNRES